MAASLTGKIGAAIANLETLLANTTAFRTWTGTADAAAAKGKIILMQDVDSDIARPRALVSLGDNWSMDRNADDTFIVSGDMLLRFEQDVAAGDASDPEAAVCNFVNSIGGIVSGMADLSVTPGGAYIVLDSLAPDGQPVRSRKSDGEPTDFFQWDWRITRSRGL